MLPIGNAIQQQYIGLLNSLGKTGLSLLYPNDFEVYMVFLELVNGSEPEKTIEFFTFPVMPDAINESRANIINIKKSVGGITTLETSTFKPVDISLNGGFGRRFKFLLGRTMIDANSISFSTDGGFFDSDSPNKKQAVFSNQIKTGYGCIKILQSIYNKASTLDENGNPYKLFYYCPALGSNYLVKGMNLTCSQAMDSNMIWKYNLQLRAIAPTAAIRNDLGKTSLMLASAFSQIDKTLNKTSKIIEDELYNNKLSKIKVDSGVLKNK